MLAKLAYVLPPLLILALQIVSMIVSGVHERHGKRLFLAEGGKEAAWKQMPPSKRQEWASAARDIRSLGLKV